MNLGEAVLTGPGKLPFKAIIHVAGINDVWRGSEKSIRLSVRNAIKLALEQGLESIAFPIVGAGSGGFDVFAAEQIIRDEISGLEGSVLIQIVRFRNSGKSPLS